MTYEQFEDWIDQYGNDVYRFSVYLTRHNDDANDLYQQTFLSAFERRSRIDVDQNPRAFLFSIAHGLWRNESKKRQRRHRIAPQMQWDDEYMDTFTVNNSSDSCLIEEEKVLLMRKVVNALKEPYKTIVCLYYGHSFDTATIARICHCPRGTVKSRLNKAREMIKIMIKEEGYE